MKNTLFHAIVLFRSQILSDEHGGCRRKSGNEGGNKALNAPCRRVARDGGFTVAVHRGGNQYIGNTVQRGIERGGETCAQNFLKQTEIKGDAAEGKTKIIRKTAKPPDS